MVPCRSFLGTGLFPPTGTGLSLQTAAMVDFTEIGCVSVFPVSIRPIWRGLHLGSAMVPFARQTDRASVKYGVVDHITIPELRRKFDLRPAKTYNPPGHLPYCDRTLLRSWLVGFIDGDGYLRKQTGRKTSFLQVTSHMSWMDFLRSLSDELHFGYCKTRINGVPGAEYASLNSAAHNEIVALKRFAIRHSLPFLERKWSKVDENLVLPPVWTDDIRILTRAGISPNDIARALGISVQSVYQRQYRDRKQGY